MLIETRNPATGELIRQYPTMSQDEVDTIIGHTQQAFITWSKTTLEHRAQCLIELAKHLREHKMDYAQLITQEMGKPISEGQREIEKCAWVCEYFAENGKPLLEPRMVDTEFRKSYVCYQPLGVILAIMPWNFPFWQVFRFAAPNLMAGNAFVLSHAPITTGCGLAIEKLFQQLNFPLNLARTLIIPPELIEFAIKHPLIRGVTLTGSPRTGRIVAMHAGSALKKVVLELGGNDPYIILKDADLELASDDCLASRLANNGQVCIAAKRLIVEQAVLPEFKKLILDKIKHYRLGNPLDPHTDLGPLAREDLRATVHKQVQKNLEQGAVLLTGGEIPAGPGFFYPPTVLTNISSKMAAMQEEIFGPVISLIPANNEEHAIELANATPYGLAAAVFTENFAHGEKIAQRIEAGLCNVNGFVASDPRLPFGGVKESGFGRELAIEGIHEFVNIKSVCVV